MSIQPQDKIFGFPLTYSLQNFEPFQQLPPPNQAVLLNAAQKFQDHPRAHFLAPEKLAQELGGTELTWRQFLALKPVQDFINRRMEEDLQTFARETLYTQYQKVARTGDNQAAKFIKELAQLTEEQSNRHTVILHYIPRTDEITPASNNPDSTDS